MTESDSQHNTTAESQEGESANSNAQSGGSSDPSDGSTKGTSERWWLTNDLLAFGLLFGMFAVTFAAGLGWLNPEMVPEAMITTIALAFGVAIAWAFGKDAVEAWRGGK